jgi:hypothetical protein
MTRSNKGGAEGVSEGGGGKRRSGRAEKVDEKLFKEAVRRALSQPRLAFYSPVASCVLNYWKSAVPRFSISEFLARVVEREIAKAWPRLYERAERELRKKSGGKR